MNSEKTKSQLPEATWNWKREAMVFACAMGVVIVALSLNYLLFGGSTYRSEYKLTLLEKIAERISFAILWPTYLSESLIHYYLFLPERLLFLLAPLSIFSVFLSGLFWTAMIELCFRVRKWTPAWVVYGLFIFIVGVSFFATQHWHPHYNFSSSNACVNNLRIIDAAKNQWALENNKTASDTPIWADILPYMGRDVTNKIPECPDGGQYTIGKIGENPKCSIGGNHSLQ